MKFRTPAARIFAKPLTRIPMPRRANRYGTIFPLRALEKSSMIGGIADFLVTASGIYFLLSLRYFLFAGGSYLIFWRWKSAAFESRRIQPQGFKPAELRRDLLNSLKTNLVFALAVAAPLVPSERAGTRIYWHPLE